jgi:hypothetical protein
VHFKFVILRNNQIHGKTKRANTKFIVPIVLVGSITFLEKKISRMTMPQIKIVAILKIFRFFLNFSLATSLLISSFILTSLNYLFQLTGNRLHLYIYKQFIDVPIRYLYVETNYSALLVSSCHLNFDNHFQNSLPYFLETLWFHLSRAKRTLT